MWRKQKENRRGKPVWTGRLMGSAECNVCVVQGCDKGRRLTWCARVTQQQQRLVNFLKGWQCTTLGCRTVLDRSEERRRRARMVLCSWRFRARELPPSVAFFDNTPLKSVCDRPSPLSFLCLLTSIPAPVMGTLQLPLHAGCSCRCIIHHYVPFSCHCWK